MSLIKLNDVAQVIDCEHKTAPTQDSGYPSIRTPNVGLGRLILESVKFVSEDTYKQWTQRAVPKPGDLILAREAPVGNVAIILPGQRVCLGQRTVLICVKSPQLIPTYLVYLLLGDQVQGRFQSLSTGATVGHLNVRDIRELPLPQIPPLPTQRKIAAILSAYDDLIENNTRRIKILEEMAQNLYREWFVKFRFPGHEHARFVDSPLGRIPEGWEIVPFSDLVESSLGGGWGSDEPNEKENLPVYIIRGTDFSDITSGATLRAPKRYIAMSSLNKRKLHKGDLLVENSVNAKSRCVGSTLIITDGILKRFSESVIAASFCKVYRFKQPELAPLAHLHMSYLHQEDKMPFYQNIATNGIGNFQSKRFLSSEHLIIPQDSKLRQEMLSLLYDLTNSNLSDAISTLRTTRDLLLPKLISGKVDVSDLDITIPEAIEA